MEATNRNDIGTSLQLLRAAVRFNALMLGITGGTLAALTVFFSTYLSITKWGPDAGGYLGLLKVFFPGYSVSSGGAWVGAFWAFLYAGVFAFLSYLLYGMMLGTRLGDYINTAAPPENPVIKPSILRLHGTSLGLAMGTTTGLGLFLSTSWLVIRGTAAESVHASLLSNYFPGYSVSIQGSIAGAMGLFIIVFLGCRLLAWVYNKIVELRHR